jgi:FKBP-type peptidyl-prolyl cis-trans isomerase 2
MTPARIRSVVPAVVLAVVLVMAGLLGLANAAAAEEPAPAGAETADAAPPGVVAKGRKVSIEYTLTLDDGSVFDTNVGKEPLTYTQGRGRVLPALQKALLGLEAGDRRKVDLPPDQTYGPTKPYRKVSLASLPEAARKEGMRVTSKDPDGKVHVLRVRAIEGDEAVLDPNHPLTGKTLHFDVKIVAVE